MLFRSVALDEVLSECRAMMEHQAAQRGVSMTLREMDARVFVQADRTRLKQVVINLLSNAIKYTRDQGSVVLECMARGAERIRIRVTDTGAGLPANRLAELFQSFNRLGQEFGVEEGTGIGLVVSKRLVELMGGTIGVESSVGVGSMFWVDLQLAETPRLASPSAVASELSPSQAPGPAMLRTVLCVEDNPANMQLVEQLIATRSELRLLTAVNAKLGLEFARAEKPDVILMDINLPGMNGVEAMRCLRADPSTAHIPVIALSANAMPRDIVVGKEAGFFAYLTKPIRLTEFMDTLSAALQVSATTEPEISPIVVD